MITLDGITLADDLIWDDEFASSIVAQSTTRTLTGVNIVEESIKVHGRKIRLRGGELYGWVDRATVIALQGLRDTVDNTIDLVFHGATFSVRFDHSATALTATPIKECTTQPNDARYYVVINLLTV